MQTSPLRPRPPLLPFAACLVLAAVIAAGLVVLAVRAPDVARGLAEPYTSLGEPQETPLDDASIVPYAIALAVCLVMVVRLRERSHRRALWVVLAAIIAWLLWRELPLSERWLGVHSFSWGKYLFNPRYPLWKRLVFGSGSIGFAVALATYLVLRRREMLRLAREKVLSLSGVLFVLAGLALVAAQALDKHRTFDRLIGVRVSDWNFKQYAEESLELIAPALLAMSCFIAVLEEPRDDGGA